MNTLMLILLVLFILFALGVTALAIGFMSFAFGGHVREWVRKMMQ